MDLKNKIIRADGTIEDVVNLAQALTDLGGAGTISTPLPQYPGLTLFTALAPADDAPANALATELYMGAAPHTRPSIIHGDAVVAG